MAKLSVIVPVFNEAPRLPSFVKRLTSSPCPIDREFIFVDDASQDDTYTVLVRLSEEFPFRIIRQKTHQGKGAAIRRGIEESLGDLVMIQDADFEYDPNDVPTLLKLLLEDRADVVYGSRFKQNAPQVQRTWHYFVNRFLTLLSNLFSGIYLTDMETCYKLFRADLIKSMNLTSKRFGIEVELTAYIAKTSARIYELPISYHPRTRLQGKKIMWKDGFAALYHVVRYNFFRSFDQSFKELPEKYHPRS
ncbi:glycosyltransferase family 2 protein [Acidobacteria bacterium AH-259-G07]|nr:glycosyltransferase family 2 protein [Acidobacteria bacterium AH-259-G07]